MMHPSASWVSQVHHALEVVGMQVWTQVHQVQAHVHQVRVLEPLVAC